MINSAYVTEKEKRSLFLLENQKLHFNKLFQSEINIGIIECSFDKIRNNSIFQTANKYAENKFFIHDDPSFKLFARKMIIKKFKSGNQLKASNLE